MESPGDFDDASAGGRWKGEDFAAGGEDGGGAIGREVGHGEIVERLLTSGRGVGSKSETRVMGMRAF